jgi:D-alanyl-D-alanine dipeptidase
MDLSLSGHDHKSADVVLHGRQNCTGKGHSMSKLRTFALVAAAAATPALGQSCPAPLGQAVRLVLVTTPDMNSSKARLQLFKRSSPGAPWSEVSAGEPAMAGTNGLAWGYSFLRYKREGEPEKVEGDKRTPAGFFPLGPSFGFTAAKLRGHIKVERGETVCVEDTSSPHYNTITTRSKIGPATKADYMRNSPLFRNGLFVNYASDRSARRGSCIFIHVWKSPTTTTKGCVALPEPRVKALQAFSENGAVVAMLPETARERFSGCLPVASAPLPPLN